MPSEETRKKMSISKRKMADENRKKYNGKAWSQKRAKRCQRGQLNQTMKKDNIFRMF